MYIKTLAATGVKGRQFRHELQKLVLFTGPNFSGKTSRIEALRFAFLGYIPELGKQAFATWDMINGTVELTFSPAGVLQRTIKKVGDTIKSEAANTIGLDLTRPLPFLNAEEYFGLTEQERIQYIFRTINVPDSYTVEGIIADLRNLSLGEENTEQTEGAKNTVIITIENALREKGISVGLTELTRDKGILKTEFAFYNRRAKDTMGAVRILSELKTAAGDVSAETLESVKNSLDEVARKLENANQIVGSLSNRAMQANQVALRRRQIEATLAEVVPDRDADIAALQKQVEKIKVPTIAREKVKETYDAHQAAETALTQAREHRDGILEKIEEVEDQISGLKKLKGCPTCKAAGKNWRAAATKEYAAQLKTWEANLKQAEAEVATLATKAQKAKTAHAKSAGEWEEKADAELKVTRIKHDIETMRSQVREKDHQRRSLAQELSNLQTITVPTDAEMSAAAKEVQTLNERKTSLEQHRDSIVRLQQDLVRAEEAAREHERAASRASVIKKMGEILRDRQAGMIDDLFGSLLKTANYFVSGILAGELVFHEGEVGKWAGATFVSHETFSGTEKALTYAAIAAALSKDAPIKLVLLDELGRFSRDVKLKVLERFERAVEEGLIDQVIAIDPEPPKKITPPWQIINVTETKTEEPNGS